MALSTGLISFSSRLATGTLRRMVGKDSSVYRKVFMTHMYLNSFFFLSSSLPLNTGLEKEKQMRSLLSRFSRTLRGGSLDDTTLRSRSSAKKLALRLF